MLLTFAATSDEVLVKSTKARVYCVVALCETLELAYQALVNDVPQVNALQHHVIRTICPTLIHPSDQ